jgi:chromosome segregation protein
MGSQSCPLLGASRAVTFIRRLEIRGFKSSGPRPVQLSFERGLTVITGPNGSGKSNIADAILFAIGENSPKALRAANGRLTGLIYDPRKEDDAARAGQRQAGCRVSVQLDNTDRAIPIDTDLVTVTRELTEKGENIYYLNGKKTTRSGLSQVLDLAGLSPGGQNIVAQGAATRVADLTPEEKRRMIEDVVGIVKFDERKNEAQRQLSQADQRLEVAMARIGEMKSTLESLDSQRNDLIRFELLEGQIGWLTAVRTTKKINELRGKLSSLRAVEQEMSAKLQELTLRFNEYETRIAQVENERTRFIVDVVQGGGSSHVDLQFQMAEVENELNSLEGDLKNSEDSLRDLEEQTVPQLKQIVATKEKEANASSSQVKQLTAEQERLEARHEDLANRLKELFNAGDTLRETVERKGKQTSRVQVKLADLTQKLNSVELAMNAVNANLSAERKRLEELKKRRDGYAEVLGGLETNVKKLYELHESSSEELSTVEADLSTVERQRSKLVTSIDLAAKVLDKAGVEVSREEAFKQMAESIAGERTGQLKLQELCDSGGVPGYVGRLSQLIRYSQAYARAVNASMGRWMGAFVVQDLRSMTQLIRAAKSVKARAFAVIPLSEVEGSTSVTVEKSAGVVGPMSSVVKCESRFTGLVNFLVGDAVLVESEAVGYLLASEGVRSVTIEGETFEPGGKAFTVGYQEILMNLVEGLENIEGIGEIEDAVGALRGAVERRRSELEAVEATSRTLLRERVKRIVSVASLKAEASTITRMASRYQAVFKNMDSEYQKQAKAVERLQNRLDTTAVKKESLIRGTNSLQGVLKNTQELGLDAMLAEIETAKQSVSTEIDTLRNRIAEVNLSLSREKGNLENVLLRTLEDNRIDLENALEDLQAFKEFVRDAPKRVRELTEQKTSLGQQIENVKESSRRSQPVLEEFESRIRRLKEERDSVARSRSNHERETFTVHNQISTALEKVEESLGSLRMLGYGEEPEVFDSSESLLANLEEEYQQLAGSVNKGAERQYGEMYTSYKNLSVRNNELEKERSAIISFIESIEGEKKAVFTTAFDRINEEFRSIFSKLTGGEAWLELENPDEIFSGGVLLMARFGTKPAWESLSLSGGEKAVSGVSLILAMQGVQPHPFYLFDEIDAALDAVNSGNLAAFMRTRSEGAQIFAITLRDVFVAQADETYGVYSAGGISRLVRYKPQEVALGRG